MLSSKGKKKFVGDIIVAAFLLLIFAFDLLSFLEYRVQDRAYQKLGMTDPNIVVMGIDEKALSKFGPFQQWSRHIVADAIDILNSAGDAKPAVIAVDVLFAEQGGDLEADEHLAKAAERGGNVVMAAYAYVGQDMSLNEVILEHKTPYPALAEHVRYGLVNGIFDSDGIIRTALLKAPFEDETLYSFPYEIYKKYTGNETVSFAETNNDAYLTYYGAPGEYYGLEWSGWSFADIFEEDFEPDFFEDCIVLIGPYAVGLGDAYYTPVSSDIQMYGVEIHANAVQMMIEGNFKTYASTLLNFEILLFFILLAMILSRFLDIRILLGIFIALAVGYFFFAIWFFNNGYILTLLYPLTALTISYIYQLVYGYITETLEKRKMKATFKKYVDPKLVDKLIESGEADSNEIGAKKNIAVLFVDIRGFTPMTEALYDKPELIVKILNEYLELTSTSVFNNGGSVDKFIGDATMALFNGFVPLDDYVFKAVKAAWDIVQGAAEVNASIKEKYGVDVGFGVGVNCGDAIVGNLGPSFRKDYTAIGDTVNTAARLESNAKRSEVLISKHVYELIKDRVDVTSMGEIPLKGKSVKLEIFSVTGINA